MIAPMALLFSAAFLLSSLPATVIAHGYVQNVTIGGKVYPGWDPNTDPYASPPVARVIRKIPDDGPVLDKTSPDLACNKGGEQGAGLVAEAPAGSQVTFTMVRWPDDHLGPVSHYMASCNGDCTKFDATGANWFKIDAAGYENGEWASTELINNGLSWTSTIPASLQPGEYLIRHEIVALHDATQPQYYPSCAQVKVTGSGSEVPTGSFLVNIPGIYDNTQWPDIWSDSFTKNPQFSIPGPPLAFGSATGNASSQPPEEPSPSVPVATSSSHASVSATAAPSLSTSSVHVSAPTGKCRRKRHNAQRSVAHRHAAVNAKRHH